MIDWISFDSATDLVTTVAAVAAAIFSGWGLWHQLGQSRRKPLIFEYSFETVNGQPGWRKVIVTIRNLEPVAAQVTALSINSGSARLISRDDAHCELPQPRHQLRDPIPLERAAKRIKVYWRVDPIENRASAPGAGSVTHSSVYVHGPSSAKHIKPEWTWADGTKP